MATRSPKRIAESTYGEHDVVRLRSLVGTDGGAVMPGTLGTIVYRHADGSAYEVEFGEPTNVVVTLHAGDLSPAA